LLSGLLSWQEHRPTLPGDVCAEVALRHTSSSSLREFGHNLYHAIRTNPTDCLRYLNATVDNVSGLAGCRGFHVVRDHQGIIVLGH
jgi:hypothetical protein